ncbi:flagellar biosynthesis protein FlhB [Evansella vedderi]|uniref:Flagellar biosynthesis protein FlhB n=1 Tax=Evansella vedderi TaxID=38282 RepID=A0ABT9ZN43_9BACI|nr:hypothetical protein [Evansella vedderi]MDQ0252645.1 flagellar biosynthesis protein FlhB [Evansella vedderi]
MEITNEIYIIIYCILLLWINISYLLDYKNIKKALEDISTDEELEIDPDHLSFLLFNLLFRFLRSWLFYILAILITGNIVVIIISAILFVVDLYQALFQYSLAHVKKSKLKLYHTIADTIFIVSFLIYYLL